MNITYSRIYWNTELLRGNSPVGLTIQGTLILQLSNRAEQTYPTVFNLPKNLRILGNLYINNTYINRLPAGLFVKGNLYIPYRLKRRGVTDDTIIGGEMLGVKGHTQHNRRYSRR